MKGYRLKRQPKKLPTVANIRPLRVVNYGASFFSAPIYGRRASRLGLVSIMRNVDSPDVKFVTVLSLQLMRTIFWKCKQ